MRKLVMLASVLVLLAVVLRCGDQATPTQPLAHGGELQLAEAALVVRGGECLVVGWDDGPVLVFTTDVQVVDIENDRGNGYGRCRAKGVPNTTGRALRFNYDNTPYCPPFAGCPCTTPLDGEIKFTTKWHQTLSASGVATISCFHPDPDFPEL